MRIDKNCDGRTRKPFRYLAKRSPAKAWLWTCHASRGDVIFHWQTSRAAARLEKIIPVDFTGTIQCDSYEAYDCFAKGRGKMIVDGRPSGQPRLDHSFITF